MGAVVATKPASIMKRRRHECCFERQHAGLNIQVSGYWLQLRRSSVPVPSIKQVGPCGVYALVACQQLCLSCLVLLRVFMCGSMRQVTYKVTDHADDQVLVTGWAPGGLSEVR